MIDYHPMSSSAIEEPPTEITPLHSQTIGPSTNEDLAYLGKHTAVKHSARKHRANRVGPPLGADALRCYVERSVG